MVVEELVVELVVVGGLNTAIATAVVPVAPSLFVALRVIVWTPTDRSLFEKEIPVPIWPSRREVHTKEFPDREPSSES